jgi:hypothetical protein
LFYSNFYFPNFQIPLHLVKMSALNSKIRSKKFVFSSEEDENLISTALSIIWEKTDKKVESCHFDKDKVRMCFKKNGGRLYFDLQDKTFENVINKVFSLFLPSTFFGQFCPPFFINIFWTFFLFCIF